MSHGTITFLSVFIFKLFCIRLWTNRNVIFTYLITCTHFCHILVCRLLWCSLYIWPIQKKESYTSKWLIEMQTIHLIKTLYIVKHFPCQWALGSCAWKSCIKWPKVISLENYISKQYSTRMLVYFIYSEVRILDRIPDPNIGPDFQQKWKE